MGYGRGAAGCQVGLGHRGDPPDRPCIPPQKHTNELQAQAEASLLALVCHLYQVGQGSGGTAGLGDTSPSLLGSTGCSLAGGEARSLWGLKGPEDPAWLQALRDVGALRERPIKRIFFLKYSRIWSGAGGAGRGWFCPATVGRGEGAGHWGNGTGLQTQECSKGSQRIPLKIPRERC